MPDRQALYIIAKSRVNGCPECGIEIPLKEAERLASEERMICPGCEAILTVEILAWDYPEDAA